MTEHPLAVHDLDCDGFGCVYYSKGHHDPAAFLAEIDRLYSSKYAVDRVEHGWHFWGVDANSDYAQSLTKGKQGQRGCFPTTYLEE